MNGVHLHPGPLSTASRGLSKSNKACDDLAPARIFLVYPGQETFPLGHEVQAIPLATLCGLLQN